MRSILDQLDHEWDHHLGSCRETAARLPEVVELTGCDTLDQARDWTHRAGPAEADQVLVSLVARSIEGDTLAARVLLGFLMPGVRALVNRWAVPGQRDETEAAAVASVYERIRCYPLARRPRKVAANVLLDAARPLRKAVCDAPPVVEVCEDLAASPDVSAADELVSVIAGAVADGHLDRDSARLVLANRIGGRPLKDLARTSGCTPRTLQRRRQVAESALATTAVPA